MSSLDSYCTCKKYFGILVDLTFSSLNFPIGADFRYRKDRELQQKYSRNYLLQLWARDRRRQQRWRRRCLNSFAIFGPVHFTTNLNTYIYTHKFDRFLLKLVQQRSLLYAAERYSSSINQKHNISWRFYCYSDCLQLFYCYSDCFTIQTIKLKSIVQDQWSPQ